MIVNLKRVAHEPAIIPFATRGGIHSTQVLYFT